MIIHIDTEAEMNVITLSESVDRAKIWGMSVLYGFVEKGEGYKAEKQRYEKDQEQIL